MLREIIELIAGPLKALPGFPLVLALVTALYLKAFGKIEAAWPEAVVLFITWASYRLGHYLDKPLYDKLFGPDHLKLPVLNGWQTKLDNLRNEVIKKIFIGEVSTYHEALRTKKIDKSGPGTLYNRCVSLLKKTRTWDERVALPLNLSKSARALVIPLPAFAATLAWSDHQVVRLARQGLGYLGDWQVHLAGGIFAIPVFLLVSYDNCTNIYSFVRPQRSM